MSPVARVLIIGGGFAGLAAARRLARVRIRCTLVDRKPHMEFLPMLPELLARTLDPELLQHDLAEIAQRIGFDFVHAHVTSIDLVNRRLTTTADTHAFDHLVIATGSETNFHGRDDLAARVLRIDNVADARRIAREADRPDVDTVVISGAGYTGIECATYLRHHFRNERCNTRILILERAPTLLPNLVPWMRHYARDNLRRMDIDVATGTTLEDYADGVVTLSDGTVIEHARVIWAAGVQTGSLVRSLDAERAGQQRLVVDAHLQLSLPLPLGGEGRGEGGEHRGGGAGVHPTVFVAGDAACALNRDGQPMRMAVQISLDEGTVAGENVVRTIRGEPLVKYRPLDLGWVVPMANCRSCGTALGFNVRGFPATMLHYAMCLFRSTGVRRRVDMLLQLLESRA